MRIFSRQAAKNPEKRPASFYIKLRAPVNGGSSIGTQARVLGNNRPRKGRPGTERRKRRRPRAGTPTREQNRRRRTAEPGPRRPRRPKRAGDGPENTPKNALQHRGNSRLRKDAEPALAANRGKPRRGRGQSPAGRNRNTETSSTATPEIISTTPPTRYKENKTTYRV